MEKLFDMRDMVLFDMDGTLTPPRKSMNYSMIRALKDLSDVADVGIVTGSDFQYVEEQCKMLFDSINGPDLKRITILPCNGTKVYRWSYAAGYVMCESNDMKDHIGEENFRQLVKILLNLQSEFADTEKYSGIPIIGHFISYRGSMINWCPMGRDSDFSYRAEFVAMDCELGIRMHLMKRLKEELENVNNDDIVIALGGNTSFDIYPRGWDKTFALSHYADQQCWFVGDSCEEGGNDRQLFDALRKEERAYVTSGPEETISIVYDHILPQLS